mmetsp:Transcript_32371/g.50440  ORF Transcript_32371/g.50440 Transcript_32371/m.50440 type:complete len:208 (-) Transcript_32371:1320-1943(-)
MASTAESATRAHLTFVLLIWLWTDSGVQTSGSSWSFEGAQQDAMQTVHAQLSCQPVVVTSNSSMFLTLRGGGNNQSGYNASLDLAKKFAAGAGRMTVMPDPRGAHAHGITKQDSFKKRMLKGLQLEELQERKKRHNLPVGNLEALPAGRTEPMPNFVPDSAMVKSDVRMSLSGSLALGLLLEPHNRYRRYFRGSWTQMSCVAKSTSW